MEQYDREELYEKVWKKPMLKVAEEYGVSSCRTWQDLSETLCASAGSGALGEACSRASRS